MTSRADFINVSQFNKETWETFQASEHWSPEGKKILEKNWSMFHLQTSGTGPDQHWYCFQDNFGETAERQAIPSAKMPSWAENNREADQLAKISLVVFSKDGCSFRTCRMNTKPLV